MADERPQTRVRFEPVRMPDDPRPRFTPPSKDFPFGLEISPAPTIVYIPVVEPVPDDSKGS